MILIMLCISGMIAVLLVFIHWAKRRQDAFNDRFPPICDAEFIARCPPGTNPKVALKVRRIVSENLGVDYQRIYPLTRFIDDLGAD